MRSLAFLALTACGPMTVYETTTPYSVRFEAQGENLQLVDERVRGPRYETIDLASLQLDGCDREPAYLARIGGEWVLRHGDYESPRYSALAALTRDGDGFVFAARSRAGLWRWLRYADARVGALDAFEWRTIFADTYVRRGDTFVYAASDGEGMTVVLNGARGPSYPSVRALRLSSSGKAATYVGESAGAVDLVRLRQSASDLHEEVHALDAESARGVGLSALSANGEHFALLLVGDEAVSLVVDGTRIGDVSDVSADELYITDGGDAYFVSVEPDGSSCVRKNATPLECGAAISFLRAGANGRWIYARISDDGRSTIFDSKLGEWSMNEPVRSLELLDDTRVVVISEHGSRSRVRILRSSRDVTRWDTDVAFIGTTATDREERIAFAVGTRAARDFGVMLVSPGAPAKLERVPVSDLATEISVAHNSPAGAFRRIVERVIAREGCRAR